MEYINSNGGEIMRKNIVEKCVYRASIWLLVYSIVLSILTGLLTIIVAPFTYNMLCGPFEISWAELNELQTQFPEETQKQFITANGVNLFGFLTIDNKFYFVLNDSFEFELRDESDEVHINNHVYIPNRRICITNGKEVLCTNLSRNLSNGSAHIGFLVPKNQEGNRWYDIQIYDYVIDKILQDRQLYPLNGFSFEDVYGEVGTYEEMTEFITRDGETERIKEGSLLNFEFAFYAGLKETIYVISGIILLLWIIVIRNFIVIILRFNNYLRHPVFRKIYNLQNLFDDFKHGYTKKGKYAYESENWIVEQKLNMIRISHVQKNL